jgi:hypothetical protein
MSRFHLKKSGDQMKVPSRLWGILLTFHIVCFGWIFFRASSMQTVWDMLSQIAFDFHPEVFMQFVAGYKTVCILMLAGYISHLMPRKVESRIQGLVSRSPLFIQALMLVAVIFVIVQMKSAGVQSFIYYQF